MSAACASNFHQIPDALRERVEPLLPSYKVSCTGGRPRLPLRNVFTGIVYVLRTGCQWKAMPRQFGSGSAIHDYFQEWTRLDIFERLWRLALEEYDDRKGIDWQWQSLDGAMAKAPLGGEKTGPNPTDRGKRGVKRSVLTDGRGGPLGVAVDGANVHDQKLVTQTFKSVPVRRPNAVLANASTSVLTKATTPARSVAPLPAGITSSTSRANVRTRSADIASRLGPVAGSWSEPIRGPTVPDGC